MPCLDRTSLPLSLALFVLAACSDDGLAPPADTDAATDGGTSSVPGSATEATSAMEAGTGSASAGDGTTGGPGSDAGTSDDTATTGETPPSMTCEGDDQCVLVDNCCECAAYHVGDEVPECTMECLQPMCAALGIPDVGVVCEAGTCELGPYDCSGNVVCAAAPPTCPEGALPEVDGGCWTGACIPVQACDPVPSCADCDETEACVVLETQLGLLYSCRAMPEACAGVPTCECMPPETCESPFDTCTDVDEGVACSCLAC